MVRKTVTLVFCDVADSTPLGEQLDPEALRGVWSRYHETAREVLERHGGTIEKFVGDAVHGRVRDPGRARGRRVARRAGGGRAPRASSQRLNDELERTYGIRIGVRTGVHTGEVDRRRPGAGRTRSRPATRSSSRTLRLRVDAPVT